MSTQVNRDAVSGEFVSDEYAAANPDTTVTETIGIDEIPDDLSELGEAQPQAPYRTLLEVWRAVLEPARNDEMRTDPISPQWATKMVTTYPGIGFSDVENIHHGVFDLAGDLAQLLDDEIADDDECLKVASAEEDAERNAVHYRNMLAAWQIHLLTEELSWHPSDPVAAVTLAVLSEVQQMFLGQTGLVGHLDSIGFQFTEGDQAELQQKLVDARRQALGQEGGGE